MGCGSAWSGSASNHPEPLVQDSSHTATAKGRTEGERAAAEGERAAAEGERAAADATASDANGRRMAEACTQHS